MKTNKQKIGTAAALALVTAGAITIGVTYNTSERTLDARQSKIDPESYFRHYNKDKQKYQEDFTQISSSATSTCIDPVACNTKHSGSKSFSTDAGYGSRYGSSPSAPGANSVYPDSNIFTDYGMSGFVNANEDNESTFGLDVDTGSFGVSYELASTQGYIDPNAIRSEEWINAIDYGDENNSGEALSVTAVSGLDIHNTDNDALVRVNVKAKDYSTKEGLNITVVVDTSGSMDLQNRLGLVKSSVALLAKNLAPEDTISLITFDEKAEVLLPPTEVRYTDNILDAINELQPGGGTNLEAGLQEGYRQANKVFDPSKNNIVLLASDGVANIGNVTAETIEDNGIKGLHLVTVGYGLGNYNDTLMEQLADEGDGFYSYLNTYEATEDFFTNEIDKVTTPVANDAKIQVTFDPEVVASYRLIGYDNRSIADEDFDNYSVDAGEFGAGHSATALYEVKLRSSNTELGEAVIRWKDIENGEPMEATAPIVYENELDSKLEATDLVADVAEYLKAENYYYMNNSLSEASGVFPKTREDLEIRIDELKNLYPDLEKLSVMLNPVRVNYCNDSYGDTYVCEVNPDETPEAPTESYSVDPGYAYSSSNGYYSSNQNYSSRY